MKNETEIVKHETEKGKYEMLKWKRRLHQESNGGGRLSVGSSGLLGSPNAGPSAGEFLFLLILSFIFVIYDFKS